MFIVTTGAPFNGTTNTISGTERDFVLSASRCIIRLNKIWENILRVINANAIVFCEAFNADDMISLIPIHKVQAGAPNMKLT